MANTVASHPIILLLIPPMITELQVQHIVEAAAKAPE